jgi:VWFA-related protein
VWEEVNLTLKRIISLCLILLFLYLVVPVGVAGQAQVGDFASVEVAQVDNSVYPQVTLYVRVTDSNGERVNGLSQVNFSVSEDGQPVEITAFSGVNSQPIRTMLLIDKSSSMQYENKLIGAKQAASDFVDFIRSQDQVAIIGFDNNVNLIQDFTNNQEALKNQINALTIGDCTSWYDAIYTASEVMQAVKGRKSMILLSDGIDCREDSYLHDLMGYGSQHSFEDAQDRTRLSETPVITIALGGEPTQVVGNEGYDEVRMKTIAANTEGQFFHTPSIDELSKLYCNLSMKTQEEYVLTYRSPRPTYDGTRRNIQVTVKAAGGQEGGVTASEVYLEKHLLTIDSDWRIAAIVMIPLMIAAVVPMLFTNRRRSGLKRRSPAAEKPPGHPNQSTGATCSHCGHLIRSGARFCPACGQLIAQPARDESGKRRCPNCGHLTRNDARFCAQCGYRY